MKEFLLLSCLLIIVFIACTKKMKTVEEPSKDSSAEEKIAQLAEASFQKDFQIQFNKSKTIVCISKAIKRRPNDIFPTLTFILYNPISEKILFNETIPRATGKWISDNEFEVSTTPGRVSNPSAANNEQGFIFDVVNITKRKR